MLHLVFMREAAIAVVTSMAAWACLSGTASAAPLYPTFLPTATDTAVNIFPPGPSPTRFSLDLDPGNYVIKSGTIPNSWKNALTLDIHNPGLRNGDTFEIRTALEVGSFDPALGVSQWGGGVNAS